MSERTPPAGGPLPAPAPDFEAMYRADPDPWEVGTSWYERRKIGLVLSSLRREHYAQAWDAGCGTGHLAAALAPRCAAVLATDASPEAARLTAARTADWPGVVTAMSVLPAPPPEAIKPDLIVLSEVLYYLSEVDRHATYDLVTEVATPDADVVAVNWALRCDGYRLPGVGAQRELGDALAARGWARLVTHTDEEFLLGVWSRALPGQVGR